MDLSLVWVATKPCYKFDDCLLLSTYTVGLKSEGHQGTRSKADTPVPVEMQLQWQPTSSHPLCQASYDSILWFQHRVLLLNIRLSLVMLGQGGWNRSQCRSPRAHWPIRNPICDSTGPRGHTLMVLKSCSTRVAPPPWKHCRGTWSHQGAQYPTHQVGNRIHMNPNKNFCCHGNSSTVRKFKPAKKWPKNRLLQRNLCLMDLRSPNNVRGLGAEVLYMVQRGREKKNRDLKKMRNA